MKSHQTTRQDRMARANRSDVRKSRTFASKCRRDARWTVKLARKANRSR